MIFVVLPNCTSAGASAVGRRSQCVSLQNLKQKSSNLAVTDIAHKTKSIGLHLLVSGNRDSCASRGRVTSEVMSGKSDSSHVTSQQLLLRSSNSTLSL